MCGWGCCVWVGGAVCEGVCTVCIRVLIEASLSEPHISELSFTLQVCSRWTDQSCVYAFYICVMAYMICMINTQYQGLCDRP